MVLDRLAVAVGVSEQLFPEIQDLVPEVLDARFEGVVLLFQLSLALQHDVVLLLGFPAALGGRDTVALAPELRLLCLVLAFSIGPFG